MTWAIAGLLLLLPLVAMQFTEEVNWDLADFIIFGAMLTAACSAYELAARVTGSTAYRTATGVALVAAFILIWINLAVGIIGTEDNPANLIFGGVLAVGIIGAVIARLRPQGISRALVATALTQASVAMIPGLEPEAVILIGLFTVLWLVSAWLFRKAAREQAQAR